MIFPSLGATHEHMRQDRDLFVRILEQNIQQGAKKNFNITNTESVTDPYSTFGTPFDYKSVMHYVVLKNDSSQVIYKLMQRAHMPSKYYRACN